MFKGYRIELVNRGCDSTVEKVAVNGEWFKRNRKYRTLFEEADERYKRELERHNLEEKFKELYPHIP